MVAFEGAHPFYYIPILAQTSTGAKTATAGCPINKKMSNTQILIFN